MLRMTAGSLVRYRFAFDIGGTFTDLVLLGTDGSVLTGKVLSDHDDVVAPIQSGLKRILDEHRIDIKCINDVVAGATTVVTNLVIERKGARTGLITTAGFRDVIEIARELRYDLYDLTAPGPDPVIPRDLRVEVNERVDANEAYMATSKNTTAKKTSTNNNSSGTMNSESTNNAKVSKKKGWSKTAKYSAIGGGAGIVLGAVINKRNPVAGGVIGGVIGCDKLTVCSNKLILTKKNIFFSDINRNYISEYMK